MVAIGSYYAGANIIHIDGGYGGTGAAPEIAKKNIAMPIEYAIPKVHDYLVSEGVRDQVVLIASGGIRTADDIAKVIALGADGCVVATAEAVAVGCTHCGNCERGRGCQVGITTTDPELSQFIDHEWGETRVVNLLTGREGGLLLLDWSRNNWAFPRKSWKRTTSYKLPISINRSENRSRTSIFGLSS